MSCRCLSMAARASQTANTSTLRWDKAWHFYVFSTTFEIYKFALWAEVPLISSQWFAEYYFSAYGAGAYHIKVPTEVCYLTFIAQTVFKRQLGHDFAAEPVLHLLLTQHVSEPSASARHRQPGNVHPGLHKFIATISTNEDAEMIYWLQVMFLTFV